ncbi:MAG: sigma-70 family RNA polymerase sigma factor [Verrucomicrobiales bacterium]|nr:sigma-70 family RNA polymerase sigma factor [Verrucomicrobiales bacterium]
MNARYMLSGKPVPSAENASDPSDEDLVSRAKSGELAAFEALATRYERRLYTLARRITGSHEDAQDVTQEALLSAMDHLAGFREEARFGTWIQRIATHAALKILRKRKGLPTVSLEANTEPGEGYSNVPHPEFIADWNQSPEKLVDSRETLQQVESALEQLDEKHRLIFLLRDVEGFSIKETAAELGLSEANVKVRLLRARLQLREQMTRAFGDPATQLKPHAHEHD